MKLLHVLIIKPLIRDESVLNQAMQILLKKSWSKEGYQFPVIFLASSMKRMLGIRKW